MFRRFAPLAALLAVLPAAAATPDRSLDALTVEDAAAGLSLTQKRARLETLNVREAALAAEMAANRGRLARLLGALELFRRDPPPALLVSAHNARDAVRAAILIRALTPELRARADAFAGRARETQKVRREAAAASEDLFAAESAQADRRAAIAQSRDALTGALTGPPTGPLEIRAPIDAPVVRRFGERMVGGGRSEGVTFRAPPGASIGAPARGTVEYVGPLDGWGLVLILRCNGAYHLVLAGLEQVSAAPGQTVEPGQSIGRMSQDAKAGTDLYFEVRENGSPANPQRWLGDKSQRTENR